MAHRVRKKKMWDNLQNVDKKIEKWERRARHEFDDQEIEKKLHSLNWRKLKILKRLHVLF
jgi:hypothetical protein